MLGEKEDSHGVLDVMVHRSSYANPLHHVNIFLENTSIFILIKFLENTFIYILNIHLCYIEHKK